MTSTFALAILGIFIPLAIGAFFTMNPLTATLVVALGGEMFLPVNASFKIPFFCVLDKTQLPYLCALIGCLLSCPRKFKKLPHQKAFLLIAFLAILASVMTGLTNGDPITFAYGEDVRPGLTLKDGLSIAVNTYLAPLLACYIGYALVRSTEDVDRMLVGIALAGLIYCPFAIIEMRFSPQFHQWVYGYSTGAFGQTYRWGGYRPKVFMVHGLTLARFFLASCLALFVIAKRRRLLLGVPVRFLAWFHFVVFILCRSTGGIVLGAAGYLILSFTKPKRQLVIASILALITLCYPLLRATDLFPTEKLSSTSEDAFGTDRSGSLTYRFRNEDVLLAHARERLLFGWGSYGRERVYDEAGNLQTIVDGHWIIVFGITGLVGFLITFGVLLWPCVLARRRLAKRVAPSDVTQLAGLTTIIVLSGVDLIPNGLWAVLMYLYAGALMRRLVELKRNTEDGSQT